MPRRLAKYVRTANQRLIVVIIVVQILALSLAVWEHFSVREVANQRAKKAAALIALSSCKGYDALELQYIKSAKNEAQIIRIHEFFQSLKQPINEALKTLKQPTCGEVK